MEDRINGARYLNFLDNRLHILLEDIPLHTRRQMWYQLDGAPAHFTRPVCQWLHPSSSIYRPWLHQHFPARWIGRGGPVTWPPRSPDLTPLDFFLWGCMKEMVYNSVIENRDHLVQRIHEAAAHIRQRRLCDNLKHEVLVRAELCLRNRGAHIEHLLQ
ncbi:hypothetical protein X777_11106 [Ooceraea biroi]|uniref:Tc1-like transposase DDE domain-containing protein n=1 Tax=Ooceraea biroi TaxID=2015173 RepID=A0A026W2N4_OOCBI|nr:hypothetical protein X777_11106 [Ooceraea biroi]